LNRSNISDHVIYEGFENFAEGVRRGNGVIFLTGHFGAWELSSFAHSVYGHPLKFIVREIDNPRVGTIDRRLPLARRATPRSPRRNAGREILRALRNNETIGILMDQNTVREEGVFANFFGIPAATDAGGRHIRAENRSCSDTRVSDLGLKRCASIDCAFDPPLELIQTGDRAKDIIANTEMFNQVLENYVGRIPTMAWIHRRWKTRPEGEPSLY
jgi:KDO2-lipid IV(A) lauroyltransferase